MFAAQAALGLGEPVNSKVEVTTKKDDGKKAVTFEFKIVPNDGMVVTFDAPWKLDIKDKDGLAVFEKASLGKPDMDEKLPGFIVTSKPNAGSKGKLEYTLVAFICTKDKTACYREVHKGAADWTGFTK